MTKILTIQQVRKIGQLLREQEKRVVLIGGCFDLLHEGHKLFLQKAKEQGDTLLILLESDAMIRQRKGENRPYQSQRERAQVLSTEENVTAVILLPEKMVDQDYDKVVSLLKPAIIATTKGDPYRHHKERQARKVQAKVIDVIERLPQYATSNLNKIKTYETQ